MNEKILENKTKKILNDLNIQINTKGYKYWIETVKYIILNNKIEYRIFKEVYIDVSKKVNTTPSKFERALRHSIEGRKDDIQRYFNTGCKIYNSSFLALIVDKIKEEM